MKELSIEELLLIMSEKSTNQDAANKAFEEMYRRFSETLHTSVRQHLKKKGVFNNEFENAIVNNVFFEVYDKPLNFSFDPDKHRSEESAFKAWMYCIARNEFADILKESAPKGFKTITIDENLLEQRAELPIEEEHLSQNRKILDDALANLPERDRHILISCYDYYEDGKKTPSEVLDNLCIVWGTTKDNVRQIKKRGLDTVKKYMEKYSQLKIEK